MKTDLPGSIADLTQFLEAVAALEIHVPLRRLQIKDIGLNPNTPLGALYPIYPLTMQYMRWGNLDTRETFKLLSVFAGTRGEYHAGWMPIRLFDLSDIEDALAAALPNPKPLIEKIVEYYNKEAADENQTVRGE